MWKFVAVFALVLAGAAASQALADEVQAIEAIDNAAGMLDEAFEAQDAEAIKDLMTPDHVAVTHYYAEPQSADEQIASLPELKYKQTNLSEPKVVLLGPDAAMRTFTAQLDGSFKGESLSGRVFVTQIMQKTGGKWREKFYQVTELDSHDAGSAPQ